MQGLLAAITLLLTLGFGYVAPARSLPPEAPATQPSSVTIYQAFDLTQTDEFDPLISQAAEDWRLDPFLLKGLLFEESGLNPKIRNKTSYAAGIAQFTTGGIRGMNVIRCQRMYQSYRCDLGDDEFTRTKAYDPEEAIPAAAELLSYLISRWGRDYGVASYNGGRFKHGFARRVIRQTNRYRTLSGLPPLPDKERRRAPRVLVALPTS